MLCEACRPLLDPAGERRLGRAVADDAAVDPAPRQLAAEPPEFDLRAAVHDDFDAGRLRFGRGGIVADAELHPHHLGADRDRVLDDRRRLARGAEHVDHIDRLGDVAQIGVDVFPEQGLAGDAGVDRDHPVAFVLQILHDEVTGPVPVRRRADHRDRPDPPQDRAQLRIGIRNRFKPAHHLLPTKAARPHLHASASAGCQPPPPLSLRHAAPPSNGTARARPAARSSWSSEASGNERRWASSK